jgi:hypothetical protein
MAKNKMEDLRNHLFATLESLSDPDNPMDLERARTISGVAQTIINSATVEVKLLNAMGSSRGSSFFQVEEESRELPESKKLRQLPGKVAEK